MLEISKSSEAKLFFDSVVKRTVGTKIRSVSSPSPFFSNHSGYRNYKDREPIYIVFENGQCLIIDYLFIDELRVDFRVLSEDEVASIEKQSIRDFFNCSVDIHRWVKRDNGELVDGGIDRTLTISLEYDTIERIELRKVTEEYNKWINGDIDCVAPCEDTFDQINFILSNGNTFVVCAADADYDGYVMAWSTDAKESTVLHDAKTN